MHSFNYPAHRGVAAMAMALALITPSTIFAQGDSTNTASGANALASNTGARNTAFGNSALQSNTFANANTAVGFSALNLNTTGTYNTASGSYALYSNTTGTSNSASGFGALYYNDSGSYNTASGDSSLNYNSTGYVNTASGVNALFYNDSGWGNTAIGVQALYNNISGHNNVAIGYNAGYEFKGSNNIAIGSAGEAGDNNTMRLGNGSTNRVFVVGVYGKQVSYSTQVFINSAGQLGTVNSSERFKKEIKSIDSVSDKLLQLRPVSFIYKEDESNQMQFGLIAEEVAKVYPELVQYDEEGKPFTVYYHLLTPLLLSELQKEHSANVEQHAEIASLNQQLIAQRAEMLALLQQQTAVMTTMQNKLTQLDSLMQASDHSMQPVEARIAAVSH